MCEHLHQQTWSSGHAWTVWCVDKFLSFEYPTGHRSCVDCKKTLQTLAYCPLCDFEDPVGDVVKYHMKSFHGEIAGGGLLRHQARHFSRDVAKLLEGRLVPLEQVRKSLELKHELDMLDLEDAFSRMKAS